jgi:hypothetical protein
MKVRFILWRELSNALSAQLTQFSPYTAPAFVALFEREGGHGGYFVVEDGNETVAALPVVERGVALLKRLQALVDGLPAPIWISPDRIDSAADLRRMIVEGIAQRKYLKAHITDFENLLTDTGGIVTSQLTSIVDLAKSASSSEWLPPDKTLRAEITKAARDGVRVQSLDIPIQFDGFINLVEKTERRHGRAPRYSPAFWHGFAELCKVDKRFQMLSVGSNGRLAAVHVFIVDRTTALNWQIYYDKEFSSLKPNQTITAHAANQFRIAGSRYLNLGATPPDGAGVQAYKVKWGGDEYQYRIIVFRSILGRFLC